MTSTASLIAHPGDQTGDFYRVRAGVRAVLALGVAASVAANVLHAQPNLVGRAIAAWSPLALLLAVELISRVPVHRQLMSAARMVAAATIAGIAAWVSYWHMVSVAIRYGETSASAHLLPLSVDGLVVVAAVSLAEISARLRDATVSVEANTQQRDTLAPIPTRAPDQDPTEYSSTGDAPARHTPARHTPTGDVAAGPVVGELSVPGGDSEFRAGRPSAADGDGATTEGRAAQGSDASRSGSAASRTSQGSATSPNSSSPSSSTSSGGRKRGRRAGSDLATKVQGIAAVNPTWTYEQIAEGAGCSVRTVCRYLTDSKTDSTTGSKTDTDSGDQGGPDDRSKSESAAA